MPNGFNNKPPLAQNVLENIASNLTGIFSTRPTAKYASGARCILKINGKIVGFAFGASWRITTQYAEINCVDDPLTEELVPQRMSVEGTISALHIPGTSASTELWQPDVLSFLFHKYISIEVRDSQTDDVLFFTAKAVITSRQEEFRVDQLSNVTLSFKAIGWRDERPPAYPSDVESLTRAPGTTPDAQLQTTSLPAQLEQQFLPGGQKVFG
jgi:hypothetical protein